MFFVSKVSPFLFGLALFNLGFSLLLRHLPADKVVFFISLIFGFIGFTLMGAIYQIIPNSQNRKLSNPEITYWVVGFSIAGLILLYFSRFEISSLLILISLSLFFIHTIRNVRNWTPVTVKFLGVSVFYLFLFSLFMFLHFNFNLIPFQVVVHTLTVGALLNAVYGVELAWIPMLLMETLNIKKANRLFWIKQISTLTFLLSFISMNYSFLALASFIEFTAFLFFAYILYEVVSNRKIQTPLPYVIKVLLVALIPLPFGLILGVFSSSNPVVLPFTVDIHINLLIYGFAAFTIFGGMLHLLPRIVWGWKFATLKEVKIPTVNELVEEKEIPRFLQSGVIAFLLFVSLDSLPSPFRILSIIPYMFIIGFFLKITYVCIFNKLMEVEHGTDKSS